MSDGLGWLMQNLEAKLKLLLRQPVVTNWSFFFGGVTDMDGCE